MLFCLISSYAQTRTVTGTVTDDKGAPLNGVTVNAIATDRKVVATAVTNASGLFSIKVPSKIRGLQFSYVGFEEQMVTVEGKNSVAVKLASTSKNLDEVVVVGYGTQQKKAFTGSASKVDAKQFVNLVTPSVDKQLAGRAAGVQVTTSGGLVNAPARIRIRGIQSISGNNDPLIVVDGIPIISGNLAASTNSNAIGDINPSDIENIEVLKDGSATAIYGSRAAGGVILITTKKGDRSGARAKVNYDVTMGFNSVLKKFDLLNAQQFVTIANEKLANQGTAPKAFMDANNTNTNWQDVVFTNNAFVQNHTLSMQGGNAKTTYYFSLNYTKQQGVVISNLNKSYRARLNIEHEVNKYVKFGNNLTVSRQEDYDQNNGSNSLGGSVAATLRLLPNVSPYASNPSGYNINYYNATPLNSMGFGANLQGVDDNWFNVAFTLKNNIQYSDKYRLINNFFVEVSPVKGLKLRSQASADYYTEMSFLSYDPRHGDGFSSIGVADNTSQNILRYVWQNYFNYNISVKKHNFYLTGGYELQGTNTRWFDATGTNISDIYFTKQNVISNTASVQSISGNYTKSGIDGLFARFNYDFGSKYFIQASIRKDGQSSLAPDKRYGTFPGFSAGWRPSEEKFWKGGIARVISDMKLKASYAKVGNQLGGFPYLSTYGSYPYGNIGGIAASNVGNSGLLWETSNKYDAGIDISFAKGRYTLAIDYFLNDVNNLTLSVPTPPSAGVPNNSITQNIGTLQNRGIEISINADLVKHKDFSWSINANYSSVQNKITSLYSVGGTPVPYIVNGNYNIIKVGEPINIIYGYTYAGVNSSNGFPVYLNAAGKFVQQTIPSGTYNIITDKNATSVGATSPLAFSDKTNLGVSTPTWFGAFTNFFNYKNWGVEIMFRYSGGNKIMNYTRQEALFSQSFHNNGTEILGRWTTPGQVTDIPKLYYGQSANINQTNNATSRFVESGDYIRLQNFVITYTVDSKKLEKLTNSYVRSLRVFVQGQNLAVWTKYKGADPDNISTLGVDAAVSPQVRTVSFGLNVGF
ncbi:MAG: TonB-dependent receptor [Bacteroidetes bacterium]|nr:TonB-dependent receptor [Bacteroidota bacterium]